MRLSVPRPETESEVATEVSIVERLIVDALIEVTCQDCLTACWAVLPRSLEQSLIGRLSKGCTPARSAPPARNRSNRRKS
jgi:hypothetical protein